MARLRCPLLAIAALAVYLAANVPVRALHHHAAGPSSSGPTPGDALRLQIPAPAGDSAGEDCSLCHALHLAQSQPPPVKLEALSRTGRQEVALLPLALPHPSARAIHSRGPPLV